MRVEELDRGLIEAKKLRTRLASRTELEDALDNTLAWADAMNKVTSDFEPTVVQLSKNISRLQSENETLHQALKVAIALAEENPTEVVPYLLRVKQHMGAGEFRQ